MSAIDERADLLRWRLGVFGRKVERAQALVREALSVMSHAYVAFSGGKDSTVVLDLVREQAPGVAAVWCDDELEHAETVAFMETVDNLVVVQGWAQHAGWFDPWRSEPFWRQPRSDMQWIGRRVEEWAPSADLDGVFLGLRRQESARRRTHLGVRGPLWQSRLGWQCNPIAGWTVDDVWAYIASRGLAYNPVYDRLAEIGCTRQESRVGPLPLSPGWQLRQGWPELYRRLVEQYGNRWPG